MSSFNHLINAYLHLDACLHLNTCLHLNACIQQNACIHPNDANDTVHLYSVRFLIFKKMVKAGQRVNVLRRYTTFCIAAFFMLYSTQWWLCLKLFSLTVYIVLVRTATIVLK